MDNFKSYVEREYHGTYIEKGVNELYKILEQQKEEIEVLKSLTPVDVSKLKAIQEENELLRNQNKIYKHMVEDLKKNFG